MISIELLTIFPQIFDSFISTSLIGKALERKLISVKVVNIRDFSDPPHHHTDDSPYGGGAGMVCKAEPIIRAVEDAKRRLPNGRVILLSAAGTPYTQKRAQALSQEQQLILICGRYEGVDQRAIDLVVDEEISIGDYILMGGEVAAMVVMESVLRLVPEVIGNSASIASESFCFDRPMLEAPHYTKPAELRGMKVPEALLSGDHARIEKWRALESERLTRERRPDLLKDKA